MEIRKLAETLEQIKKIKPDGTEYWCARDLWSLLGYSSWRNFKPAIERAMESCQKSGFVVLEHFAQTRKKAQLGLNKTSELEDYDLTRYACYLIAQNGNPKIPEIAFAQRYFAIQTRRHELVVEQIAEIERLIARKQLAKADKDFAGVVLSREVNTDGLREIISIGDYVLFGNNTTNEMKKRLHIHTKGRALADFLPTVTIKAKDLAAEATTYNAKMKDLHGKEKIMQEHMKSNQSAREFLLALDIIPENLPPAEDIKKVERRHEKQQKLANSPREIHEEDTSHELMIDIPEDIEHDQILLMKELFDVNPGDGKIILKFEDKKILIRNVEISDELPVHLMEILNH